MQKSTEIPQNKAYLDRFRLQHGIEAMRDAFYDLFLADREKALGMLNDSRLQFPTLYALRPEIAKLALGPFLSAKNRTALETARGLLARGGPSGYKYKPEDYRILQWIFHTGCSEPDLGDRYDEIMDLAALLLVKEHHDLGCLRPLARTLFDRHRKGTYTYDAEWALFECADAECLYPVAEGLLSKDTRDVVLARKLLKFIPSIDDDAMDPAAQYRCVKKWIDENRPYLRYTGESSQADCDPCRFEISHMSRYLQKDDGMQALSVREQALKDGFLALDPEMQARLGEYSYRLRRQNPAEWNRWIGSPLQEQIEETGRGTLRRRPG